MCLALEQTEVWQRAIYLDMGSNCRYVFIKNERGGEMTHEKNAYFCFSGKGQLEKSINSLLCLLEGSAIGGQVMLGEVSSPGT